MLFVDDMILVIETKVKGNCMLKLWSTLESKGFRLCRAEMKYIEYRFSKISN